MHFKTRIARIQWRHARPVAAKRLLSWAASLESEMQSRPAQATYDYLSPTPSHLLTTSLTDFVPAPAVKAVAETPRWLPQGHHLVYFPLQLPPSGLLADGTDPAHSPGPAFT